MNDIIVLKCGGSSIDTLTDRFYKNIKTLQKSGLKPIIVHGGGPAIKDELVKLGIKTEMIDGLRKTTAPTMKVVERVLAGMINDTIVKKLKTFGMQAVGLSGADAQLLKAKPKNLEKLGFVGEITAVNTSILQQIVEIESIPVIAPIGIDSDGVKYNINADTAAGSVAKAVGAKQLVFVTDVPGIMKENKLLESVTEVEVDHLINKGTIYGGMIPKVKAALSSLGEDLHEAMIVDGNQSILKTDETELVGTVIKKSVGVVS